MKNVDFLIIGGSAAGTTAAEVIRSSLLQSSITILTDENYEQYSRVLLPHYIRHKVGREHVFLKKPDWYQKNKIDLVKKTKAIKLDAGNHTVVASNNQTYKYGKLLITIGGYVVKLKAPGADLENILYMRTIEDADRIIEAARNGKKAIVVGGGFIGLEFATGFKMNDVENVTVLVLEDYYWQGKLDRDSSKVLQNTLEKNGIKIMTNEEVESFEPSFAKVTDASKLWRRSASEGKTVGAVKTKSGKMYEADVVGVGIGIRSDLSWLEGSGIKINRAIVTNEYLETNLPNIYAAGDCAEFWDVVFGRQHIMGNWANATSQGNAVGKTMSGQRTIFETASSYSINFFDGSCSFIGVTDEKFADEAVNRGSVSEGKMTRIFIKTINGVMRMVGATIINDPSQVSPLTMAAKNRIDISKFKEKISDSSFELRNLVASVS